MKGGFVASLGMVVAVVASTAAGVHGAGRTADAAFAAGDFDEAARGYAKALALKPGDTGAEVGLATIELYRNALTDSARHVHDVLAADATNAAAKRIQAEIARRRAGDGTYRVEPFGDVAKVPFVATDPLPVLAVRVQGHDAYLFVDTGAPGVVLDPDFAKEIGVPMRAAGEGIFAGGQHAPVMKGEASSVALGSVTVNRVPVTLLPTRRLELVPGKRLDGIIGTGFLYNFLSTIDYVHAQLVLRPRSASATFEREAANRRLPVARMWLVGDHFVFARGRFNEGPEGLLNVDTGLAGSGVQATKHALDDSKIVLDEAHASQGVGGGGPVRTIPFRASVTVGKRRVDDVAGVYTPDGSQYGIFPFAVRGTVSHGYFRGCALTFDFAAMRLVMANV